MSEPRLNVTLTSQRDLLSLAPQRVLLVNSLASDGTTSPGTLLKDIPNDDSWEQGVGPASFLAQDIRAFKRLNKTTPVDAIVVALGTGQATSTVTFSGSANTDGTVSVTVASRKNYKVDVAVPQGTTLADIVTALAAAITGLVVAPVEAAANVAILELASKNDGLQGNNLSLEVSTDIPGLVAVATAFSGGTAAPTLTDLFDVVGDQRYQTVCAPAEWGSAFLTDFLDPRFNVENDILDGVGFNTFTDDLSGHIAAATALDSASLVYFANKEVTLAETDNKYVGSALLEQNSVISAQFAALRSLRLTEGADIANIVVTNEPADQIGGPALASLPYANTPFFDLALIDRDKIWALVDEEQLNAAGASIFVNNKAFSNVLVSRVVTTYKTDAVGLEDSTFKFLNAVDTGVEIREVYFDAFKAEYAQARLTIGDVVPNVSMVNTGMIRAFCVSIYQSLGDTEFVLTEVSQEIIRFYKQNLSVEIEDLQEGRVKVSMRVVPVSQLRTVDMPIEVVFTI